MSPLSAPGPGSSTQYPILYLFLAFGLLWPNQSEGQVQPENSVQYTDIRGKIAGLEYPALRFTPPTPRTEVVEGVQVFFLEDRSLPLVSVHASFKGGVARFPRGRLAVASALPALLRTGGAGDLRPDSVDTLIESMALGLSFGQGGGAATASFNGLVENMEEAMSLWGTMLKEPRFDSAQVEIWRGREVERVRRRLDNPGSLAFSTFNSLMFGDHPIGWEMGIEDLEREDLTLEKFEEIHQVTICPDNMMMAVAGDLSWDDARLQIEDLLKDWPPCSGPLRDLEDPNIRRDPGVFVIHREVAQTQIVMAHRATLRQGDSKEYFASRIGNSILGASGLSSRLMQEVRARTGYAYSAGSLWNTSRRRDGLIGALTQTKPETTVDAVELITAVVDSMGKAPPSQDEVDTAVEQIANGFVFNFQTAFQIVARRLAFARLDLPEDWLERFVEGIQGVSPEDVRNVFRAHSDPALFTVLIVGDTTRFAVDLKRLGPVTYLDPELTRR